MALAPGVPRSGTAFHEEVVGPLRNVLNVEESSVSLARQIAECGDAALLPGLVSRLLGCACEKLQVEGPISILRGAELTLGHSVYLSAGCEISNHGPVRMGDCVVCGPGVKIRSEAGAPVWIGDRVWIGEGAVILPGARIGDDAIICAGTRVEGEVAARTVVAGNPWRVLRVVR